MDTRFAEVFGVFLSVLISLFSHDLLIFLGVLLIKLVK